MLYAYQDCHTMYMILELAVASQCTYTILRNERWIMKLNSSLSPILYFIIVIVANVRGVGVKRIYVHDKNMCTNKFCHVCCKGDLHNE